ncbi:MAG: hypothetical protein JNL72_03240, partial [Flavipsychrobacter sp.]|nr:hypothetical protein [Flavipsychrobacter sp.]
MRKIYLLITAALWGLNALAQCPVTQQPTYTYACSSGDFINSLTIAGTSIPNMAGCNGQTNNYRFNTTPVFSFNLGTSYTYAYTTGTWSQGLSLWIDLDNNGVFDASERLVANASTTSGSGTFLIPTTATAGTNRRMRVRCSYASTPANTAACTNLSYGECEDFFVNLVGGTNCSGTPTAGTVTVTGGTTFCASGTPSFGLSGTTLANGITYQWQYSTNGGTTWTSYTGATSSSYTPTSAITTTTMVRCVVGCSFSGLSANTTPVTITINPNPTVSVSPQNAFICGTGSVSLTASGTGTSYSWSPGTGLSSTTGATVTASPTSNTNYVVTATLGGCTATAAAPVNVAPALSGLTATATPSAICSGSSTQLAGPAQGTSYNWYYINPALHTLTSPQTASFTSNDDGYATVAIPFQFNYYGTDYSTVYIGTNGYVGFSTTSMTSLSAQNLPNSTAPNNLISLFWHDMNLNNGGTVTYSTEGIAPNRRFVIYYNDVKDYSLPTSSNNKGQVILYETSNVIDVLVAETRNTGTTYSRTLGIEDANGTAAVVPTNRNLGTWQIQAAAPEGYRFARAAYNYLWSPAANLNDSTIINPVASNNTTPTTFTVNVSDVTTGCAGSATVSTTINPLPAATMSATDTLCDGQAAVVTFTGTPGATVKFREDSNPVVLALDGAGTVTYTSAPLSATTVYYLDTVISTQGCKALYNVTDTAVVNPRPTASISGTTTICDGLTAYLMVNVGQGAAPWTITYTDGSATYTETSTNTSFAIAVTPNTTTTYTLTGMVDALCTSVSNDLTGSATITVNPRPTATLAVPQSTICDGTMQNLNVTLTGTPPFNFDVFDGTAYTSYTNIMTSSYNISINPSNTTTYSVTSLTDANCVAYLQDLGSALTVTVNPRPTANIQNNDVICNGNSTNLLVTLTGTAPWSFSYFNGTNSTTVNNVVTTPYMLTLTPNTTANYTIVSVTDGNNCSAYQTDITGSSNVVVNYNPVILSQSGNVNTCAGSNAVFSVNVTGTALVYQWTENGAPIQNGGVYSGANTPTLQISDITGLGGNVYQLNVAGVCPPAVSSSPITLTENTQNNWIGVVDTKWSTPGNWSCGILPTAATNVNITPSAPFQPEVDIPTAICRRLLIYPGSSVEIIGSGNALEVKTDVINLGQFDADAGKLILSGNGPQNAPGVVYKELEVLGGSVKTFLGNVMVTGNLNLYAGYIQLGQYNLTIAENANV